MKRFLLVVLCLVAVGCSGFYTSMRPVSILPTPVEDKADLAADNRALEAKNARLKASVEKQQEEIFALRDIVRELSVSKPGSVVSAEPAVDYQKSVEEMKAAIDRQGEEIRRAAEEFSGIDKSESVAKEEERVSESKGPRRVYRVGRIPRERRDSK